MTTICESCKRKKGMFDKFEKCGKSECEVHECDKCKGIVLQPCQKCSYPLCVKHRSSDNHNCDPSSSPYIESEDSEDGKLIYDSDRDDKETDEESNANEYESKTKKYVLISGDDEYQILNSLESNEKDGYKPIFMSGNSSKYIHILMVKRLSE